MDDYSYAPEFGLHGAWALDIRLSGLGPLIEACAGKNVLDLGAAEGLIARRFLDQGAALVHGYDIVPARVAAARRICQHFSNANFWEGDLSDWDDFRRKEGEHLLPRYDIVLYLGLHHHLPSDRRMSILLGAASMSNDILTLRTPDVCYREDGVAERLRAEGWCLSEEHTTGLRENLSPLRVFRRTEGDRENFEQRHLQRSTP